MNNGIDLRVIGERRQYVEEKEKLRVRTREKAFSFLGALGPLARSFPHNIVINIKVIFTILSTQLSKNNTGRSLVTVHSHCEHIKCTA